jgi:flagellar biosynthetic protein FliQ
MSEWELSDLARQALVTVLRLAAPVLAVGVVVGILTGALQAMTQVHDHALSFAPKLLIMLAVLGLLMPWMMQYLSDYARQLLGSLP